MKKNLVIALALVFVLGIAGTAFAAANPFTDVPAKHWAYDAVNKLAKAGILDGYGDGTYRGERTATRYEMAQATAKAMARADKADAQMKALIDKLAVEFAAELNNLGVRVAKLEKNASSIKFTGDARIRYQTNVNNAAQQENQNNRWQERIRLNASADLNDMVSFQGRIVYDNQKALVSGPTINDSEDTLTWEIGQFNFKYNPNSTLSVGRMAPQLGNGFVSGVTGKIDGAVWAFKADSWAGQIGYADWGGKSALGNGSYSGTVPDALTNYWGTNRTRAAYWGDFTYGASKSWSVFATAFMAADTKQYPFNVWGLGVQGQLSPDWKFLANYAWNTAQEAKDINTAISNGDGTTAWAAQIQYKGADRSKVGTWGLYVNYRDLKPMAMDYGLASGILGNDIGLGDGMNYSSLSTSVLGRKGWGFQGDYTISKNVILTATYLACEDINSAMQNAGYDMKNNGQWYLQANMWF